MVETTQMLGRQPDAKRPPEARPPSPPDHERRSRTTGESSRKFAEYWKYLRRAGNRVIHGGRSRHSPDAGASSRASIEDAAKTAGDTGRPSVDGAPEQGFMDAEKKGVVANVVRGAFDSLKDPDPSLPLAIRDSLTKEQSSDDPMQRLQALNELADAVGGCNNLYGPLNTRYAKLSEETTLKIGTEAIVRQQEYLRQIANSGNTTRLMEAVEFIRDRPDLLTKIHALNSDRLLRKESKIPEVSNLVQIGTDFNAALSYGLNADRYGAESAEDMQHAVHGKDRRNRDFYTGSAALAERSERSSRDLFNKEVARSEQKTDTNWSQRNDQAFGEQVFVIQALMRDNLKSLNNALLVHAQKHEKQKLATEASAPKGLKRVRRRVGDFLSTLMPQ